jgi:lipopolysaccharide biosynthesis glycosyltransferase
MPTRKKILDVLYQSDNNYAVVTGVSIASLLENNKDLDEITINLIDGGITKKNLENVETVVRSYGRNIHIIDGAKIQKQLERFNCRPYKGSYVTYFKLLAFGSIEAKSGKILMLDGDILVMQSLRELCDMDLNGYVMSEIVDPYMPSYLTQMVGIPKGRPYWNAGVMFINQKEWNKQKCEQQIIDHWEHEKSDYLFADQDVTNILFGDKIKELDLKYNFYSKNYMLYPYERVLMNVKKDMLDNIRKNGPVCVHCIDESWRSRPWFRGNSHSMSAEWDMYLAMTPWWDWEKLETKINTYHKIDKLMYKVLPRIVYAYLLKLVSATFARLSISRRMLDSKKMNVTD